MTAFTCNARGTAGSNGVSAKLNWRANDYGGSTSARYLYAWNFGASASATEANGDITIPVPGMLRNLYVKSDPITPAVTYTIRVNGVDTTLTASLASGVGTGSDTTHSVNVAIGDIVTQKTVTVSADGNAVYPAASVELVTA